VRRNYSQRRKAVSDQKTEVVVYAVPLTVTAHLKVVAEPPGWLYRIDLEAHAKVLETWAREINDFLRDHRSQDPVILSVERVTETICSVCRKTWEEMDGGCSYCGALLKPPEEAHDT
jgi:hypothetical protein